MDRRRLTSFVAVAEELHFNRAAVRCHISQSALSQQLAQLEDGLGVQLLSRTKRHVSLTRAGEVFLQEARKILRSMDSASVMAQQAEAGMIGRLRIGTTTPALFIALPELVRAFRLKAPLVSVSVHPMTTAEQEIALHRGDIDVGIVHTPIEDKTLACHEMMTMPFDVVLSSENPLAEVSRLRLKDLAGEPFILFPRQIGPQLYDSVIGLCLQEGFSPRTIVEATPAQAIVGLAACNVGVGFVASQLQHFQRPLVVYRRLEGPAPFFTMGIAHLPQGVTTTVEEFVALATA